jgi:hypothetical protein
LRCNHDNVACFLSCFAYFSRIVLICHPALHHNTVMGKVGLSIPISFSLFQFFYGPGQVVSQIISSVDYNTLHLATIFLWVDSFYDWGGFLWFQKNSVLLW